MNIKSLAYKTDLIFARADAIIKEYDNYLVIKTPEHPDYFWGNYIIASEKLKFKELIEIYKNEFAESFNKFISIGIDSKKNENYISNEFLENGFSIKSSDVLTTEKVTMPEKYNEQLKIKILETDKEWESLIEVHKNENWYLSKEQEIEFLKNKIKSIKKLTESGVGKRFIAIFNDKVVGDLGIYKDGVIGRFNDVTTHQDYRNMGICQTLMYHASDYALKNMNINTLVIVADKDYYAKKIYLKLGFTQYEEQLGFEWYNPEIY